MMALLYTFSLFPIGDINLFLVVQHAYMWIKNLTGHSNKLDCGCRVVIEVVAL